MLTVDRHGLPSALAERLTHEVRASFAETPREGRFKFLAQALNLDEAALLAELSRLTGLEVLEEPAIDPEGMKVLPARIASEAQVVPTLLPGGEEGRLRLVTALPPDTSSPAPVIPPPSGEFQTAVPTIDLNVILARPTATGITMSIMSGSARDVRVTWSPGNGDLTRRVAAGIPLHLPITGLAANQSYRYRVAAGSSVVASSISTMSFSAWLPVFVTWKV